MCFSALSNLFHSSRCLGTTMLFLLKFSWKMLAATNAKNKNQNNFFFIRCKWLPRSHTLWGSSGQNVHTWWIKKTLFFFSKDVNIKGKNFVTKICIWQEGRKNVNMQISKKMRNPLRIVSEISLPKHLWRREQKTTWNIAPGMTLVKIWFDTMPWHLGCFIDQKLQLCAYDFETVFMSVMPFKVCLRKIPLLSSFSQKVNQLFKRCLANI